MGTCGIKTKVLVFLLSLCVFSGASAAEGAGRRFGLFIGSNNGGRGRAALRYAVSDAQSVSRVFTAIGGIAAADNILLVDPGVAGIKGRLESLGRQAALARRNNQRTELVFYYSGHSDENGLLLNRERYGYRELREQINSIQADMRIVILDSCSSGAITRAKGGVKTNPFLFDTSISAEGYAFLTSSSADETSQESDSIAGSYFTHSLVSGLIGAADSVGDGRITLNELYRFAYDETLAKTETSRYGAQHPSYDIQISGSGDVVLTDIKETSAGLVLGEDITGRLSIRDRSNFLVAELTKTGAKVLELGLEPGLYRITLRNGGEYYSAELTLAENSRAVLGPGDFTGIAPGPVAGIRGPEDRGGNGGAALYSVFLNVAPAAFRAPLIGLVNIARGDHASPHLGLINWNTGAFATAQTGIINTAGGNTAGIQVGVVNTAAGGVKGAQIGAVNTAGKESGGVQVGVVNTAAGGIRGPQIGAVNTAGMESGGIQVGLVNTAAGGIRGPQIGAINTAFRESSGVQAGVANIAAGGLKGPQIGVFNSTRGLRGLQVGILNYADTVEKGMPLGLLSIVRHGGYYAVEMSFSETMPLNLAFKLGVEQFYTSLNAAYEPGIEEPGAAFAFGIGFGSIIPVYTFFFLNPEINAVFTIEENRQYFEYVSLLAGFNLGSRFSVVAGPSLTHMYVEEGSRNTRPLFMAGTEIAGNHHVLFGVKVGIRSRF
jgi:hypothetical protein